MLRASEHEAAPHGREGQDAMTVEIFDCEQGSEEWVRARVGIPTASEFATVMAKGEGKTRTAYMRKLAGEIITGEPMENYSNAYMERGKVMEAEARSYYAFMEDAEPRRVGFIRNGNIGCSPDSLVGDSGMHEIKTAAPHVLIDFILKDQFPPEHMAQCQGNLLVSEREWIDLSVYWPGMPRFVKRLHRDDAYLTNLRSEIERFHADLAAVVERVRRYGMKEAA